MLWRSSNSTTVLSRVPTRNLFIIQGVSWLFFITGDRGSEVQDSLNAQENLKLRKKAERGTSVKCPYAACSPCLGSMCAKEQAGVGSWIPFACSHTSVAPTLLLVGNSAQATVCFTNKNNDPLYRRDPLYTENGNCFKEQAFSPNRDKYSALHMQLPPLLADTPWGFVSSHLVSVVTRWRNRSSHHSPLSFPEASNISKPQEWSCPRA